MTDTIISIIGLVITILGVPCALAFTFSSAYKKVLAYVLIALLCILFLFALTWTAGILFADNTLREHVNALDGKSALETVDFWKLSFRNSFVLFSVFAVSCLWVYVLRFVDNLKEYEQRLSDEREAAAARKKALDWAAKNPSQAALPAASPSQAASASPAMSPSQTGQVSQTIGKRS
jgi:hypothetical protein